MARDIVIHGETLVVVKGGAHLSGVLIHPAPGELGLAQGEVRMSPRFIHRDITTDDYGPEIPAEVQWMLAEIQVSMTLINWDKEVLDAVAGESMAGLATQKVSQRNAWFLRGAGSLMGNGKALFASGCHYMSLGLLAGVPTGEDGHMVFDDPYRLRSAYLVNGYEIPLGTNATALQLNWRVIPYSPITSGDVRSSGVLLMDRGID